MLSPLGKKIISILPDSFLAKVAKYLSDTYIKKYAKIEVYGYEEIRKLEGPIIFICNHLSNADGLILNKLLKEDFDPTFVAGVKLSDDPITKAGTKLVKNIPIKPNSADKDAITSIVKTVRGGSNLVIFPEGTRSRTGSLIEAKKGILLIARMTKAKIVPIGMAGTDKLLPISEDGNMGSEKWHHEKVVVKFGQPFNLSARNENEVKQEYDNRLMYEIMRSIAVLLPENYRGFYK